MYYKNGKLDPDLPPARAPRPIQIPSERTSGRASLTMAGVAIQPTHDGAPIKEHDVNVADLEAIVAQDSKDTIEERRAVLHEVREHLDILKEFQDLVPEEELNKRKRELYLALPDAPPPAIKKRFSE